MFSTPVFQGAVFFYRGIFLLGCSIIITLVVLITLRKLLNAKMKASYDLFFSLENSLSAIVFCSSFCLSFFVIVPVTIERSVTTFMLGRMERSGPMTKDQIRSLLAIDYMDETNAVERRTNEQIISGNLKVNDNGEFELTNNARWFLRFSEFLAALFSVQPSYNTNLKQKN